MIRRVAAVLCLAAAAALAVLAADVLRTPGAIAADDVGFHGAPLRQQAPWDAVDFLPQRPAVRILDVEDDLAYRRTIWLFRRVQPGKVAISGPELEAQRGKAVLEVTDRSRREREPRRRAQLLNLSGVLGFARYSFTFGPDRERVLLGAVGAFRNAVRLDPGNADARANLELALRAADAANLPGEDPDTGGARGRLSGQGRSGTGY